MSTNTVPPTNNDTSAELDKKLAQISEHEQTRTAQALATELGMPFLDSHALLVDPSALKHVSESQSRASGVALIQLQASTAVIAALDPRTQEAQAIISSITTQYPTHKILIVDQRTMESIWQRYTTITTTDVFEVGAIDVDDAALAKAAQSIKTITDIKTKLADIPVTELFEMLIAGALATRSSDIHFEPESDVVRLRYRLDGLLHEVATIDKARYQRVLSRVKVLSKMKLNITKAPQDGRFTIRQSDIAIEVRVSVLPSEYGESIVMRLLDPRGIQAKLEDLGMRPDVLEKVKELLARPQGTLLTTGPTGSGKTTTLYAFLNFLNTPDMKIITVEDPIEYHIKGVNQTQVEPSKGYTFAGGLRAIARQDPDIILIGEIRDLETASIALEAALTGHMVLSTIHTNDAAGTIPRLVDIGVRPDTVAPALTMAMGQRLVRRLCEHCKKPVTLSEADSQKLSTQTSPIAERFALPKLDTMKFYGPGGCAECNSIGYKGRVGVYEVFEVTRAMERLILDEASVTDIRDLAIKEGMVTMVQDGYLKLIDGVTSIEEIHRVLG
ncbi:MAG: type II/IV secretion system protein [Candidatus Pacebacteria bacterium]|nr:type II/IV secretion system protein [Candidatus Paceibacterota bacterium]